MHELGITRNILSIVTEAADGRKVREVRLEVGKLSGIMADAIVFCFDALAKGTPLEGAALRIDEIEGRGRCSACGTEFTMPTLHAPCPCGSRQSVRLAGEELKVKTLELESA